ncbi:FAD-dependent oxidoreductase [Streptomyces peucetius]|uniref:GMC family oxidoreductase n=1 Tax=Streptomyces peucetius TaxID=1950 RepID=A0ABY6HZC0_STRPE|nr:GMC family oxidoreductase [Streptomyces peucetius]UYQ60065.1 GMC family oxidoreductase [Streptomyces peucetius]
MSVGSAMAARRILGAVLGGDAAPSAHARLTAYLDSLPAHRRREALATSILLAPVPGARNDRVPSRILRRPSHLARTLAYVAHYSDEDCRRSLGYSPTPGWTRRGPDLGNDVDVPPALRADACVIGAGAAGTIIAHHLASTGRSVILLEEGIHRQFGSDPDEMEVLGSVYRDGALQLSRDKGLSVLQACGLGGSTMVNNGICTYPGDPALSAARGNMLLRWRTGGAVIDLREFDRSRREVEDQLSVHELPSSALGRNAELLLAPGPAHEADARAQGTAAGIFRTNLVDCLGCGLCNYGCPHGRRASVVDRYLLNAVGHGLRVITRARVRSLEPLPRGVAVHATVGPDMRSCTVTASTTVVAAGAISSSALLRRSQIGGNVGTHLSHNLSFPVLARMPYPVRAHAEVPMSAYVDHGTHILESVFFPPAALAALLPEWGKAHRESMDAYDHFAGAAVLTASQATGRVLASPRRRDAVPSVLPGLGRVDRTKPRQGLRQLARHFLNQGAEYLLFPTLPWSGRARSMPEVEQVLAQLDTAAAVSLSTAHPQGGNPMNDDPRRGVVDSAFRLHGSSSIYVCDASVFPTALGLNPQLTVMALADICGNNLAERYV